MAINTLEKIITFINKQRIIMRRLKPPRFLA